MGEIDNCLHNWEYHKSSDSIPCVVCNLFRDLIRRYQCLDCLQEICYICT